jgi:ABC-type sugar transport system substrate-binding protein
VPRTNVKVLIGVTAIVSALAVGSVAGAAPTSTSSTARSTADTLAYQLVKTPATVAAARKAGAKQAAKLGKASLPKKKKIGLILLSAQSTTSVRIVAGAKQAAAILGYSVVSCDTNFDPQKVQQCATSMIAQNIDLVLTVTIDPSQEGGALDNAASKGTPWFGLGTYESPNPKVLSYYGSANAESSVYNTWLFKALTAKAGSSGKAQLVSLDATSVGAGSRLAQSLRLEQLKKFPQIDEVVDHNLDLTNIVQDTLNTTQQAVQQYPNLTGFWTVCDLCVPLMAQALDSKGLKGASRPIVSGEFSTPQTVVDIRGGSADGVMDEQWEASAWVAIDQALELWAHKKAIPKNGASVYSSGYSLKFLQPYILDKTNIKTGPAPVYGADYVDYFKAKWAAEFGTKG